MNPFEDEVLLEKVNSIVHPFVRNDFNDWCSHNEKEPYIINESAIVFSSGLYKELDKIICVSAPLELRLKRVLKRDNSSEERVNKIADRQLSEEERIGKSDYILNNDETQLLIPQIIQIHKELLKANN